ncbi:hypothetical protein ACEPAF_2244 [Sanghuangporus sanghuang]
MFKFNFSYLDIEDDKNQNRVMDKGTVADAEMTAESIASSCREHDDGAHGLEDRSQLTSISRARARELTMDELVQALPPAFSYSPLVIPLSSSKDATETSDPRISGSKKQGNGKKARNESSVTLLRRDLFDARYQLISETDADSNINAIETMSGPALTVDTDNVLRLIDNPSDLVPGVYEGGLKTWECSLDLVDYLSGLNLEKVEGVGVGSVACVRGKRVIEIGCGTAIPSLYLLHVLFSHPQNISSGSDAGAAWTELVLQDYNDLVLRLVTFPNVLLTWYASPLAETYRTQHPPLDEGEEATAFDQPGDLQITPELLTAFRSSLEEQHISIRFIAGSWRSLADNNDNVCTFPFDITLTSETIYQTSSLSSLITLLKRCASSISEDEDDIATRTQELSIKGTERRRRGRGFLCLVAAKVFYFGVGGGVIEFEGAVREAGGKVSTALECKTGVGRRVMSVEWT